MKPFHKTNLENLVKIGTVDSEITKEVGSTKKKEKTLVEHIARSGGGD